VDFYPRDDSEANDQRLRLANRARRRELEEKYGAVIVDVDEMSATVEAEWLRNMLLFEEQMMSTDCVPIRSLLGNPNILTLDALDDLQVSTELERMFDLLADHRIHLSCLCEVPERELYRFVVEELLDIEIVQITAGDWWTEFIYEEFHPNDE
jgi:hypothetical protein